MTTLTQPRLPRLHFGAAATGAIDNIFALFERLRDAHRAARLTETMLQLSDEQLAQLGIDRTDIPAYVCKRYFGD